MVRTGCRGLNTTIKNCKNFSRRSLESLHPVANRHGDDRNYRLHLAFGSHSTVILRGGPLPLVEEPDTHFTSCKSQRLCFHFNSVQLFLPACFLSNK